MMETDRLGVNFGVDFPAWQASLSEEERGKPHISARWMASVAEDDGSPSFRSLLAKSRLKVLDSIGSLLIHGRGIEAIELASVFRALDNRMMQTIGSGERAISRPAPIVPIQHDLISTGVMQLVDRGPLSEE